MATTGCRDDTNPAHALRLPRLRLGRHRDGAARRRPALHRGARLDLGRRFRAGRAAAREPAGPDPDPGAARRQRDDGERRDPDPPGAAASRACCRPTLRRGRRRCAAWSSSPPTATAPSASATTPSAGPRPHRRPRKPRCVPPRGCSCTAAGTSLPTVLPASPWLSGAQPGALDFLAVVVSRWSGARAHLAASRPDFHALLQRLQAHPAVAPVWQAHWPG